MIVASRMNWAALTPSRAASRSTRCHRSSPKRTVVARIGMAAEPTPMSVPVSECERTVQKRASRLRNRRRARILPWVTAPTFAEFYDRHAAELLRTALGVLGDAAHAEDVTQDVFLTVWRGA